MSFVKFYIEDISSLNDDTIEEIFQSLKERVIKKKEEGKDLDINFQLNLFKCQSTLSHEGFCGICHSDINKKQYCKKLKCDHLYHSKCINEWVMIKYNCPTCRNNNI